MTFRVILVIQSRAPSAQYLRCFVLGNGFKFRYTTGPSSLWRISASTFKRRTRAAGNIYNILEDVRTSNTLDPHASILLE